LELSKLLQDRCIYAALLSETHLKLHERFIYIYRVYRTDRFPNLKGRTAGAVRYGIPHARDHVDLPPVQLIEATGIIVPIGRRELLAAVYKPPSKPWCDEDAIHLVNLRNKSGLAGDSKDVWSSHTSNPSGEELLTLLIKNDFQISAPPSPTHYMPRGNDILNIVIHRDIRLSGVTMSDALDSDHLPIFFSILEQVCARDSSARVETHRLGPVPKPDL
jgi:hypothetical protein